MSKITETERLIHAAGGLLKLCEYGMNKDPDGLPTAVGVIYKDERGEMSVGWCIEHNEVIFRWIPDKGDKKAVRFTPLKAALLIHFLVHVLDNHDKMIEGALNHLISQEEKGEE